MFPALLEHDVPFGVHVADAYWNDVGSIPEYLQGNLDVLAGAVEVEPAGDIVDAEAGGTLGDGVELSGRLLVGAGARIADGARLDGPIVVGPGARGALRSPGQGVAVAAAGRGPGQRAAGGRDRRPPRHPGRLGLDGRGWRDDVDHNE